MRLEDIKRVGVLGCGLMGSGIAQVCAQNGYYVYVRELSSDLLARGLGSIKESIYKHMVEKGKIRSEQAEAILSRIKGTADMAEAVMNVDIVIETTPEDLETKKEVFAEVEKFSPHHTIFASNTSSLMITEIASAIKRKEKLIGMHWFYPPQVMKLVEVTRGMLTSDETYNIINEFSVKLGKVPVTSRDSPGFVVVRLLAGFMADAIRCAEAGVMSLEDIDKACKLGLNHPMGPFELMDFTGLDTYLRIYEYIYKKTGDPRFHPPLLLEKMVASGHLGRKSGRGFYHYDSERPTNEK